MGQVEQSLSCYGLQYGGGNEGSLQSKVGRLEAVQGHLYYCYTRPRVGIGVLEHGLKGSRYNVCGRGWFGYRRLNGSKATLG